MTPEDQDRIASDQDQYPQDLDEFEKWFLSEIANTVQIKSGDDAPMAYKLCVSQICRNLWEHNKQLKEEIECLALTLEINNDAD